MSGAKQTSRKASIAVLSAAMALSPLPTTAQQPLPQGGNVVSGGATIGSPAGGKLTINQSSQNAIINWNSFSVGQPNTVTFNQPGASAAILNRVTGNTPSSIAGQVTANGQVFLVNPNGISITSTGQVRATGGFVASTLDIANEDFNAGRLTFSGSGASAAVSKAGRITTAPGGFVALLGGSVSNVGTITVPLGRVGLGSGERATLDLYGDGFLQVAVPTGSAVDRALVDSSGRVRARGGQVELKAATVREAIRDAVNVSGVVSARSVSGRDGVIVLGGDDGGRVRVTGKLDAGGKRSAGRIAVTGHTVAVDGGARVSARSQKGKGGDITVTANDKVAVGATTFDASGATGGGRVRIGGDYRGGGELTRARETVIGADAVIKADATDKGNGGTVIVWSDSLTTFEGFISARGGRQGGDGGFAEVSGKAVLDYRGFADLRAPAGRTGTLLLDPEDIVIADVDPGGPASFISTAVLEAQLAGADTIVSTNIALPGSGNITVAAPIAWDADTTLTLDAANNIIINTPITATGDFAGLALNFGGTYTLAMGTPVTLSGASSTFSVNGNAYTLIHNATDLQNMNTGLGGRYALAVDIDANTTASWNGGLGFNPVGDNTTPFMGTFDGLGHTITGVTINRPSQDFVGLFGYTAGATIRNVGVLGGSVAGRNQVGGLVGYNISNSTILRSYATGNVTGTGNLLYVGGLVGFNGNGSVLSSYATGNVTGTGTNTRVGGLIGWNENNSPISRSYATGTVTGTGEGSVLSGGLIGANASTSTITTSYATGSVTGTGTGTILVGGLVGSNTGTITTSHWDADTTGQGSGFGYNAGSFSATPLTTVQARTQASYANFDFTNDWYMVNGQTRPFLRAEWSPTITNAHQLQLMAMNLGASYALAHDIDATMTAGTNPAGMWSTAGFSPVGSSSTRFTGTFDGQSYVIDGLTIDRPTQSEIGLFGYAQNATIRNVGLVGGTVTGNLNVGGLVGSNTGNSTITASYSTANVTGVQGIGGLVGNNSASTISESHATGNVTATGNYVGGLAGINQVGGSISASYATGNVESDGSGTVSVGGLAGYNASSSVSTSYATGSVTGTGSGIVSVGGLVGFNIGVGTISTSYATGAVTGTGTGTVFVGGLVGWNNGGAITASFWDTETSGTTAGVGLGSALGATGRTTAEMQDIANFATNYAGWDFVGTWVPPNQVGQGGGSTAHYPELYALTRAVAVQANSTTTTYGDATPAFSVSHFGGYNTGTGTTNYALATESFAPSSVLAAPTLVSNATQSPGGFDNAGIWSVSADVTNPTVAGTDGSYRVVVVPGTYTVNQAALTVTANNAGKTYDGLAFSGGNGLSYSGFVNGETASVLGGTVVYGGTAQGAIDAGSYSLTASGLTSGNYAISYVPGQLTVNQAALTVTANNAGKTYDGLAFSGGNGVSFSGFVNGENAAVLGGAVVYGGTAHGAIDAGTYDITVSGLTSGNYAITYVPGTLTVSPAALTVQPTQSMLGHMVSRLTPVTFAPNAEGAVSLASCDPVVVSSFLREEAGVVLIDPVGQAGCGGR